MKESNNEIVETTLCSSGDNTCFQTALDQMQSCQQSGIDFGMRVIVGQSLNLDTNLTIEYGDFDIEGKSKTESIIDVRGNQIVIEINNNNNCSIVNVTLTRSVLSTDTPILRITGAGTSSWGGLTIQDVEVNYTYALTDASSPPVVIENLIFAVINVNVYSESKGLTRLHNAADHCVITTQHTAVRLNSASGVFRNTNFSNINSGALYVKGGYVTFENVGFAQNVILHSADYPNLRHNVFFENTGVTINGIKSDVTTPEGNPILFFTTNLLDISNFTIRTGMVSLLYSPKADKFEIENIDGHSRGKFVGDFLPCSYFVRFSHDNLRGSDLYLPLVVESRTAAYFDFPDNSKVSTNGNYTFFFYYTVGTNTTYTPEFTLHYIATNNNNSEEKPKSKGGDVSIGLVVGIVVAVVVVVVAVSVVVIFLLLRKNNTSESKTQRQSQKTNPIDSELKPTENGDRSKNSTKPKQTNNATEQSSNNSEQDPDQLNQSRNSEKEREREYEVVGDAVVSAAVASKVCS